MFHLIMTMLSPVQVAEFSKVELRRPRRACSRCLNAQSVLSRFRTISILPPTIAARL